MTVQQHGLCIVSDRYFSDFPSIRHMSNKHESRPYYFAVRQADGIIWLIPLSSQVDKYREKIKQDEKKHGESIFYYIAKVKGEDRVFLIGNMIPAKDTYIKDPFTVKGIPYIIENKIAIREIRSKSSRYLTLVRQKKLFPVVDILQIERQLLNREKNTPYLV